MAGPSPYIRSLRHPLPLVAAIALAACSMSPAAPGSIPSDPALQDHTRWCGMNPPSGYCIVDDHR